MAETNYDPDPFPDTFNLPAAICISGNCSGAGAPDNSLGFDGYTYIDESSGSFYVKSNGSWGPTGAGIGGLTGSGSPEGVEEGDIGQHYWDSLNRIDYIKTSGDGTNTGWEVFLGI